MFRKKGAFTIVEILLMLVIVGIIMGVMYAVVNPTAPKYKSMYYYAFSNTKKMIGEVIARRFDGQLPTSDIDVGPVKGFCSLLVGNLNIIGGTSNCTTFYAGTIASPFNGMTTANLTSPNFTFSNGERVYLSARNAGTGSRIISIDLNGQSNPNAFNQDVVAFAVFDNGEIFPLGPAAEDTDYLKVTADVRDDNTGLFTSAVANGSSQTILKYREGFCMAGNKSTVYPTYCNNAAPFSTAYTLSNSCNPAMTSDTCIVTVKKPVLRIKI